LLYYAGSMVTSSELQQAKGVQGAGKEDLKAAGAAGRNSRYRNVDILVRLELANAVEADKNVRAPFTQW